MNKNLAFTLISEVRSHVSNYIEDQLAQRGIEGLVSSHGSILTALYMNEGKLPMKEIAERIHRTKSTVTQLVDKLIKHGYVIKEQSEEDARVYYIFLTEKGWSFQEHFITISAEMNETFFQGFSELEQEMFLKMLVKVKNNFEQ